MNTFLRWPRSSSLLTAACAALTLLATASAAPTAPHTGVEVAGEMPRELPSELPTGFPNTPGPQTRTGAATIPTGVARSHRVPLAVADPTSRAAAEVLVTRPLDIPAKDWLPGHRVVDLRAAPGTQVLASLGGTVSFAGVVAGTPVVTIAHRGGLHTTYEPVRAEVAKGEVVTRGQRIGTLADPATLGPTARTPDGLSWGAWVKGEGGKKSYLDPFDLLGAVRVRLLR